MSEGNNIRTVMQDNFFNKKNPKREYATARNLIFSLLIYPLVSCGPQLNSTSPQAPLVTRQVASSQEAKKTNCSFDFSNTAATITYERSGNKLKLELDVPDGVSFSRPIKIFCQEKRTVVVTKDHAIRALGYDDMAKGKQMLGVLADGSFNPQNAIVFNLSPLGEIVDASAADSSIIVSNKMGKRFGIDVDNPAKPAKHLGSSDNKSL